MSASGGNATAITLHESGGHADSRTTLVYIRKSEELERGEVERVQI
jgi:hypothetical protein